MSARLVRTAVVVGLVASVAAGSLADAAKRPKVRPAAPVCNLVADSTPDGKSTLSSGNDPALDIKTADIATDGKTLTTVIRVEKAATTSANAATGFQFQFTFSVGSAKLYTTVTSDPVSGVSGESGYFDATGTGNGKAEKAATIDTATNEIRLSAPVTDFAPQAVIKIGSKLEALGASSKQVISVSTPVGSASTSPGLTNFDTDTSAKNYIAGTRSCVKIGS